MKLEIKLIPSDMNEAQAILKALGGFTIGGTQKVTDTVGAVSHTVETDTAPVYAQGGFVSGGNKNKDDSVPVRLSEGVQITKEGEVSSTPPEATVVHVKVNATESEALPTLKDLTLGEERDSANRLWCAEINTSNKGTKADGTFKRTPKLDDAYFEHVINLLEQEAVTYEPEPAVAPVPEIAPAPQPEPAPAPQPEPAPAPQPEPAPAPQPEPAPAPQPEPAPAPQPEPAPAPQPEPAPAPQPEPAPAPQRVIVAYMYQGQRYNPDQLSSWTEEQIKANCEPVYDDVVPVETVTVCLETQVKPLVSELAGNDGMAIHCQKLCGLLSGKEKGIPQDVPEEKRGQLLKALETMKANKVAVKDGSMPVEQLI